MFAVSEKGFKPVVDLPSETETPDLLEEYLVIYLVKCLSKIKVNHVSIGGVRTDVEEFIIMVE